MSRENPALSTDIDDPRAVPYFLWHQPMTVADLRRRLGSSDVEQRAYWLATILREARDTDVWKFTTPLEVARLWPLIVRRLGRRRAFWEFLFRIWREEGLLDAS